MNKKISGFSAVTTAVTVLFCALIFQMCIQLLAEGVASIAFEESITTNVFLATLCKIVYGVSGGLIAWFILDKLRKSEENNQSELSGHGNFDIKSTVVRVAVIIIFGLAMQMLAYCVLNICYGVMADTEYFKNYGQLISKLEGSNNRIMFLYTMLAAPFLEEFVFRGLIFYIGREGFGFCGANVLQALMFGLYHGNLIQGIYAFVLGLLLGYMAEHRRNMAEPVLLHIVVNATGIWVVPKLFIGAGSLYAGVIIAIIVIAVIIKSAILEEKHLQR